MMSIADMNKLKKLHFKRMRGPFFMWILIILAIFLAGLPRLLTLGWDMRQSALGELHFLQYFSKYKSHCYIIKLEI